LFKVSCEAKHLSDQGDRRWHNPL